MPSNPSADRLSAPTPSAATRAAGISSPGISNKGQVPVLAQAFQGVLSGTMESLQIQHQMTQDTVAMAERTAQVAGGVLDKVAALNLGDSLGGYAVAGLMPRAAQMMGAGSGGLPTWAAYAQSGMLGATPATASAATSGLQIPPTPPKTPVTGSTTGLDIPRAPNASGAPEGSVGAQQEQSGFFQSFHMPTTFKGGEDAAANYKQNLGEVRQDIARGINRRVSEWGATQTQDVFDSNGVPVMSHLTSGFAPERLTLPMPSSEIQRDSSGNVIGSAAQIIAKSQPMAERAVEATRGILSGMAAGEGAGASVAGALPAVGTALGVAGAAYFGAMKARDFAQDQRKQNMAFQSVLGGSNEEGFGERMSQAGFRISQWGTMSGGEANEIYKGGLEAYAGNKAKRDDYQGAAVGLYRNVGMGADEINEALGTVAKTGNNNLQEFALAMREVSRAAKESGENAKEARKIFMEQYTDASSVARGSAAVTMASSGAMAQTEMGRGFANVTTQQNDPLHMRLQAQLLGQSYYDFQGALISDSPGAGATAAAGSDALVKRSIDMIDPTGRVMARAKELFGAMGGTTNPEAVSRVAGQLTQEFGSIVDPTKVKTLLGEYGGKQGLTEANALEFALRFTYQEGTTASEQEEKRQKELTTPHKFNPGSLTGGGKKATSEFGDIGLQKKFLQDELGIGPKDTMAGLKGGFDTSENGPGWDTRSDETQLRNTIANQVRRGSVDPLTYQLYKERGKFEDSRFIVSTKDGKRSVDLSELGSTFADQLKANPNSITIQGGSHDGETVGDVFGYDGPTSNRSKTKSARSDKASQVGKDVEDGARDTEKGSGGTVHLTADKWVRDLVTNFKDGSVTPSHNQGEPPDQHGN